MRRNSRTKLELTLLNYEWPELSILKVQATRVLLDRPIYAVQFHPEVAHTDRGDEILSNFLFKVAKCRPTWTAGAFIEDTVTRIRQQVGEATVICGLSGGC